MNSFVHNKWKDKLRAIIIKIDLRKLVRILFFLHCVRSIDRVLNLIYYYDEDNEFGYFCGFKIGCSFLRDDGPILLY